MADAARLCRERGARLTPLRARVLEIVWRSHRPSGAYDILAVLAAPEKWPDEQRKWLEMVSRVVIDRSLGGRTDREGAMAAFEAHAAAVKALVPDGNVLVFQAKDGWEPLCDFLGVPVPDGAFPRSNSRQEFFELLASGGKPG